MIAETMRLRPPAWLMGRRLTADVDVDGWHLPAGSLAVASQWVLHRDERFWPQARQFRPVRWLDADGHFDEHAPGQPRGAWFPFGLGHRSLHRRTFRLEEAVLVLSTLAALVAHHAHDSRGQDSTCGDASAGRSSSHAPGRGLICLTTTRCRVTT